MVTASQEALDGLQKEQKKLAVASQETVDSMELWKQEQLKMFSVFKEETSVSIEGIQKEQKKLGSDNGKLYDSLEALKQDYATMVQDQKRLFTGLKDDIENQQKKLCQILDENSITKNRVDTLEKITKETSTIFVTKVADLADYSKKLDKRCTKNESYGKELGNVLESLKNMFEEEKASLSKIISNLKEDFVDLHERCDHSLKSIYRNETQNIIDKYVFELSQLNVLFESSRTMQRENNYFKCIGNLSSRIDKIEQKIS